MEAVITTIPPRFVITITTTISGSAQLTGNWVLQGRALCIQPSGVRVISPPNSWAGLASPGNTGSSQQHPPSPNLGERVGQGVDITKTNNYNKELYCPMRWPHVAVEM